jgi:ribonuclease E
VSQGDQPPTANYEAGGNESGAYGSEGGAPAGEQPRYTDEAEPSHEPRHEPRERPTPARHDEERTSEPVSHHEVAASAPPPAPSPVEAHEAEPPRRRSTVREAAPIAFGGDRPAAATPATPAETPAPVVSSPVESEEAGKPRRSGWWSRKVLGKD